MIGRPLRRMEDARLPRGRGRLATFWIRSLRLALTAMLLVFLPSSALAQDLASEDLADKAARLGTVRVVVRLVGGFVPEPDLPTVAHVRRQRQTFAAARAALAAALTGTGFRLIRAPAELPVVTLEVDGQGVGILRSLPGVAADVVEDELLRRTLTQSVPLVGAPNVWALGYDGSGTIIAIVDEGVESTHPFLAGKVVREACFSTNYPPYGASSLCPGAVEFSEDPGSAAPCSLDCSHGTHVAGIAAGGDGSPGSGVAPGAALWPIQVFSRVDDPDICFPELSCVRAFVSDIIEALNYLYTRRTAVPGMVLAAANMSLGGLPLGTTTCNGSPMKPAIDQLRAAGIASVVATGSHGYTNAVSSPACISTAISVGSTGDTTGTSSSVSFFSNLASFVSVLAPGEDIVSSVPPTGFASFDGTSMATPHVAGAFGILRQFAPQATVGDILNAFRAGGEPVTDTRSLFCFGTSPCPVATVPRIRILEALNLLRPDLVVSALTAPTRMGAGQTVAVAYTVKNQSSVGAAGQFDVGIYLSDDNVIDPSTDLLLATRPVTGLAPNASLSDKTSVTAPDGLRPGTYFVGAFADFGDAVVEVNETNNSRASASITTVAPDVATTAATAPVRAAPGAVIAVRNTVKNNATAPLSSFTVGFHLSTDDVLDGGDVALGTRTVGRLGPTATSTASTSVRIPAGTAPGAYRIIVRADEGLEFSESDEANNLRATGPIVIGPDLVVTAVTAPAKAQPGQAISLSGTVRNVGTGLVAGQTSTLAYYLSSDTELDGSDTLLGTRTVPALGAGATSSGATSITLPAVPIGVYFVIARADDGGALTEAREDNNTRATVKTILVGPDIAVTVATGPGGRAPGLPVTIGNTVVNKGPVAVGFTVGFYLSSDEAFDGGDVLLGTRTVTRLGAGAGSAASTKLTIPANTAPGVYRVLVRADHGEALQEADESNNVKATGPINVALPDLRVSALSMPLLVVAGRSVSISNRVRNDAPAPGAAAAFTVGFYLSSDSSPARPSAGITTTFSGTVQTSGAIGGTFTFVVTNGAGGRGTFSGTATSSAGGNPGTLNAALTGAFTTGEICAVVGNALPAMAARRHGPRPSSSAML